MDACEEEDYSCRRQGWNWEDGSTYNSTHLPWFDGPGGMQEPEPGELCVKLNQTQLYGMPCHKMLSCLCERQMGRHLLSGPQCDFGWKKRKDKCYLMNAEKQTFQDCRKTCLADKAVIATVANSYENDVLKNL